MVRSIAAAPTPAPQPQQLAPAQTSELQKNNHLRSGNAHRPTTSTIFAAATRTVQLSCCSSQLEHQHQLRSRSNSHLHKRVSYRKTTIFAAATRTVQLSCGQLQQHRPKSNSNSGSNFGRQHEHQHQLRSRSNSQLRKRVSYRKATICASRQEQDV